MIYQYEPLFERKKLAEALYDYALDKNWYTEHWKTKEFEQKIREFLGVKYVFCVNNGTISLSMALLAEGIKAGHNVVVPSHSMMATANAVKLIGANPIFVDIDPENGCLNLEKALKEKDIQAVIYVSLNGRSHCEDELKDFIQVCQNSNIVFIEDAAQAFGSKRSGGQMIGNDDHLTSFSLSVPKIISTGQGGILTTNDEILALNVLQLKDHGRSEAGSDVYSNFGINSKFTDLQAIVGLSQMEDIEWRINRKKDILSLYIDNLYPELLNKVKMLYNDFEYTVPWFIEIFTDKRDELKAYLLENDIKTRTIYQPIYSQGDYKLDLNLPNSEEFSRTGLWLPSSLTLTDEEIIIICQKIKEFLK